jgi:quinol-cytochrome oxidoreductase complex cytochrome b subunit
MLNHSINYIHSNPLVTPNHIVPEWYFLPFYAILRCISNKELGILYMLFSIILLYFLPKLDLPCNKVNLHNTLYKEDFWIFFFNLVFLGFLGMEPINNVSITFALICTGVHFIFLINPYIYTNNNLTYLEKKHI